MQILSSHTVSAYMRQDTLVSGGFADGKDSKGSSASATDQLLGKLAENIPGMSASEMHNLDANEFSPTKVAERIAGFVAQGLEQARARGATDSELDSMFQAAMSGVEQGFQEAREILDGLDMLTPELTSTIDETQDLTFEALAGLAPGNETAPSRQVGISAAERYAYAETFSMDVMTKEGDKVSIRFDSSASETTSMGYYSDDNASAVSFGIDRQASSNYSFSVKGDLNDEELEALQNLVQDINLIAEDFYSGDVQEAFNQATELQMDKSQLKNLNVTMTQSASYSAVATYESVQQMDNPLGNNGRHLGQLMNNFERFSGHHSVGFLEHAGDFGADLLDSLIRQDVRYKEADEDEQNNLGVNADLLNSLLTDRVSTEDADD